MFLITQISGGVVIQYYPDKNKVEKFNFIIWYFSKGLLKYMGNTLPTFIGFQKVWVLK